MWFLLQTRGVLWEVRTECHVSLPVFIAWMSLPLLHCNNSLIPDRKQQYQRNPLLGFWIVHFRRNLIIQNHSHFPLQICPQLRPWINSESLNEVHRCSETLRVGHLWASRDRPLFTVWPVESLVAQNIQERNVLELRFCESCLFAFLQRSCELILILYTYVGNRPRTASERIEGQIIYSNAASWLLSLI